jgi:mRNA degradation ribonuclease J1/J2
MAQNKKEKRQITEPFHLPLEDAKELFKDIKAYGQNVIVVGLHPVKRSALEDVKSIVDSERQKLARKGFLVISIGEDVKSSLKEGNIVSMPDQSAVVDSITREMIVKDVFPALRKFTAILFPAHYISHYVVGKNTIETSEQSVDMDYILDEINRYKKEIEKQK